jgi:hypothetical protein
MFQQGRDPTSDVCKSDRYRGYILPSCAPFQSRVLIELMHDSCRHLALSYSRLLTPGHVAVELGPARQIPCAEFHKRHACGVKGVLPALLRAGHHHGCLTCSFKCP